MFAIEAENLVRTYESRSILGWKGEVRAVDGVSLQIGRGELYGLLGPNGAGKTTTIRILTTLLLPTAGRASILGLDIVRDAEEIRRLIGVVYGGDRGLYGRISARDNLRYFANLYGLNREVSRRRINDLLEMVGLAPRALDRVEGYSRGMKQRLHIARALLHDPDVIFLDEPTIGIDPIGARQLRQLVLSLREQGKTILLTTHYMLEADVLADRVGIISGGRMLVEDTPQQLKRYVQDLTVCELEVAGVGPETLEALRALAGVRSVTVDVRDQIQVITIQSPFGEAVLSDVHRCLGVDRIRKTVVRPPTLEDAYVTILEGAAPAPTKALSVR